MHEVPNKPWSASGLDKLIKKIDDTDGTDRTNGSGRPKSLNQKIGHHANSPDLNPVDYSMLENLSQR